MKFQGFSSLSKTTINNSNDGYLPSWSGGQDIVPVTRYFSLNLNSQFHVTGSVQWASLTPIAQADRTATLMTSSKLSNGRTSQAFWLTRSREAAELSFWISPTSGCIRCSACHPRMEPSSLGNPQSLLAALGRTTWLMRQISPGTWRGTPNSYG